MVYIHFTPAQSDQHKDAQICFISGFYVVVCGDPLASLIQNPLACS